MATVSQFHPVQTVMFIALGTPALGDKVDRRVQFGGEGTIEPFVALALGCFQRFCIQQGINAATAIFFQHTHQLERNNIDLTNVAFDLEPIKWEKPTIEAAQHLVGVGDEHAETDRFAVRLGDKRQY
jgi:hypothetical protein